ncbi:MAG: hypothetical protein Q9227_001209 [Pyrenula ochraceoflavens]
MDPTGIALGALAAADECIKLYKHLQEKWHTFQNTEKQISEVLLKLFYHSVVVEHELQVLHRVYHTLEESHQLLFNSLLNVLRHKLQQAVSLVDDLIGKSDNGSDLQRVMRKSGRVKKVSYVLNAKKDLDKIVNELDQWHQMFNPTWVLISRVRGEQVDNSLDRLPMLHREESSEKGLVHLRNLRGASGRGHGRLKDFLKTIHESDIEPAFPAEMPHCSASVAAYKADVRILIDTYKPSAAASIPDVREELRHLALTLAHSEPMQFGLLECLGLLEDQMAQAEEPEAPPGPKTSLTTFRLVFRITKGLHKPRSLRQEFLTHSDVPLNVRLILAQSLANATLFVHASNFVHKNISPESIVLFENESAVSPSPFLLGFEKFRLSKDTTLMIGDLDWTRNLYRHPKRQGQWPEDEYDMFHDIYSLGVAMLEIGLWTSFITFETGHAEATPPLEIASDQTKDIRDRSAAVKEALLTLARKNLPARMGTRFTDVVISCLTGLDEVDSRHGEIDSAFNEGEVAVGVRFIEQVSSLQHSMERMSD